MEWDKRFYQLVWVDLCHLRIHLRLRVSTEIWSPDLFQSRPWQRSFFFFFFFFLLFALFPFFASSNQAFKYHCLSTVSCSHPASHWVLWERLRKKRSFEPSKCLYFPPPQCCLPANLQWLSPSVSKCHVGSFPIDQKQFPSSPPAVPHKSDCLDLLCTSPLLASSFCCSPSVEAKPIGK